MPSRKLPRSFYARETLTVARDLLGMHLVRTGVHGRQIGRIVASDLPPEIAEHSRVLSPIEGLEADRMRSGLAWDVRALGVAGIGFPPGVCGS